MIRKLYPNFRYKSISDIEDDFFKKHRIKNVILDIDNTLVPYSVESPDENAVAFLNHLQQQNINVCLVSNNSRKRVGLFNKELGLYIGARACKPLTFSIRRAMRCISAQPSETAIIGDQVFTDIYGGNRAGITTILVEPIEGKESAFFKFKRKCEKIVLDKMERDQKHV